MTGGTSERAWDSLDIEVKTKGSELPRILSD